MENRIISFVIFFLFFSILQLSVPFTPRDNYLVNCGSKANATVDDRSFVGDSTKAGVDFLSSDESISLTSPNAPSNSTELYSTARGFTSASSYAFRINKIGIHLVRLHFSPFTSQSFNLVDANFGVSANGFLLLKNFSAKFTVLKEYILMIDKLEFEIQFMPTRDSGFAFVSAIEVFSAPDDFIIDNGIRFIGPGVIQEFSENISSQTMETVHRINVGGPKLTPFNDTLWRTWVPDEDFLVLKSAAKIAEISHSPNYQKGGATREIAPDNVYMTAQQMNKDNMSSVYVFNITWDFPVVGLGDVRHLVRLHFCDIVSISLNQLYFNVYINGFSAYKDLDLSSATYHVLASPYYTDFVVDSVDSNVLRISVGPSDLSSNLRKNAILNGVEIMKMINFEASETIPTRKNLGVLVGSTVGGFIFLALFILAVLVLLRCMKKKPKPRHAESMGWTPLRLLGASSLGTASDGTALTSTGANGYFSMKIPFSDVQLATNNFDKSLIIGSGGFGMVYKGILRDNTKVAVKRGVPGSRQGLPEFQTEIAVLSKIRHRHLVSLIGYCEEQSEMILVYEYMEKGPLKNHLYGLRLPPLSWKQRLQICIGAARGLHYLHTGSAQGIIHRDIKSTNILLDDNYVAKVADFGLSRSGPCLNETHVSTGVKGSFGYLDPEYFRRQQLTDKSDVYSFGVVLFEVICARPAVDPLLAREQVNLAEWAMQLQKKGLLGQIIDPHVKGHVRPSSLKKFTETAEKCLADYGVDRPTMGDVLWNLEYALQLQETGEQIEPHEDSNVTSTGLPASRVVPQVPSRNIIMDDESAEGTSDISTGQVFSQLMTREGR